MSTKIPNNVLILTLISSILQQTVFTLPKENVLKPYDGPSIPGVDPNTLTGKVMTGYQGWFNCEGDGANLDWLRKNVVSPLFLAKCTYEKLKVKN
jgi:hypothetical protein